jgi:hypothetical protein
MKNMPLRRKKSEEEEVEEEEIQEDKTGKITGLVVFLAGIGLLALIFYIAYLFLINPAGLFWLFSQLPPTSLIPQVVTPDLTIYEGQGYLPVLKVGVGGGLLIVLLLAMASVVGRIIKYGLDMYRAPRVRKLDQRIKIVLKGLNQLRDQLTTETQTQ